MVDILKISAALVFGYLLGSLNTTVLVGKLYGKDIRSHGSKSAGLTNTLRVLGKPAAALVLAGDVLKAVIACLAGLYIGVYLEAGGARECVSLLAAGMGAVMGHNWPVYFGFKGGKGALTAVSVAFMINWAMGLMCIGIFILMIAITRYVSLGSVCASVLYAGVSFVPYFSSTVYFNLFACMLAGVVIFKHRGNLLRLVKGTENKLSFKKQGK
jgi:glycerol-3-phosphate acyltransferase PlsY